MGLRSIGRKVIWTIPADRTKTRKVYRVPLTDAAMAQLPPQGDPDDLVFSGNGDVMSDNTLGKAMKNITAGTYLDATQASQPCRMAYAPHSAHGRKNSASIAKLPKRVWRISSGMMQNVPTSASDQIEARRGVLDQWAAYLEGGAA